MNMNILTHKLCLAKADNSYWKMKGSGRCKLIEDKNSKMVVPLKYFCLKYLHVHRKGGSGFMKILPELVLGSLLSALTATLRNKTKKVSTISSTLLCNRAHLLQVRHQPLCSQVLHVLSF